MSEECEWSMIVHDDRVQMIDIEEAKQSDESIPPMLQSADQEAIKLENKMVSRKQIESLLQQCAEVCVVGFLIDTEVIGLSEAQGLLAKYDFETIEADDE